MELYDCKVRCDGKVQDEVRKRGVTAAEIRVLRLIHGDDAVVEIRKRQDQAQTMVNPAYKDEKGELVPATYRDSDIDDERGRLELSYGDKVVAALFGPKVQKITESIEADAEIDEAMPAREVPKQKPVELPLVTRGTRGARAAPPDALDQLTA